MKRIKKIISLTSSAFTLVEVLGVVVILAIILAITVPNVNNAINASKIRAFSVDARSILEIAESKKMKDANFDLAAITLDNIKDKLDVSNNNYKSVALYEEEGQSIAKIVGKNNWDGLSACGTIDNIKVYNDSICGGMTDWLQPVITLKGDNPLTIEAGSIYSDAGATAIDNVDGDISDNIEVVGTVNTNVVGTYLITYNVHDKSINNAIPVIRTVNVVDSIAPTLAYTLSPASPDGTNGWYKSNVTVDVNVTDNGSGTQGYEYALSTDGGSTYGAYSNLNTNTSFVITQNGSDIKVKIRGKDNADNYSADVYSNLIKIDRSTPTITSKASSASVIAETSNVITDFFNIGNYSVSGGTTTCKNGETTITNSSFLTLGSNVITCTMTTGAGRTASADTTINVCESTHTYAYSGTEQPYTIQVDGTYELSAYGASGESSGGLGGYVLGRVHLTKGTVLKIKMGGTDGTNGGGTGTARGGGATTIYNGSTLLLTAAGGGGGTGGSAGGSGSGVGGAAGGSSTAGGSGSAGGGGGAGGWYKDCTAYNPTYACNCSTCGGGCSGYNPTYACNCSTCGGECNGYDSTYYCYCSTCGGGCNSYTCTRYEGSIGYGYGGIYNCATGYCNSYNSTYYCYCSVCGGGCNSWAPTYACNCSTCGGECNGYNPTYACNCSTCGGGCSTYSADKRYAGTGGSNYINPSLAATVNQAGVNSGNGYAVIKYISN